MKRRREIEREKSEIRSAIEELSLVVVKVKPPAAAGDGLPKPKAAAYIPTEPFLHLCNLLIQVLDKIGPTMAVLRQDMAQNIKRLEMLYDFDPPKYANVVEMLKKEAAEGNARKGTSCSRSFVWLTRSVDFSVALLENLVEKPEKSMEHAVEDAYTITLKQWHGWISSAAYKVALKLLPDNKTFINHLMGQEENHDALKADMQTFISLLVPFLDEVHSVLRSYGLDRLKST